MRCRTPVTAWLAVWSAAARLADPSVARTTVAAFADGRLALLISWGSAVANTGSRDAALFDPDGLRRER